MPPPSGSGGELIEPAADSFRRAVPGVAVRAGGYSKEGFDGADRNGDPPPESNYYTGPIRSRLFRPPADSSVAHNSRIVPASKMVVIGSAVSSLS